MPVANRRQHYKVEVDWSAFGKHTNTLAGIRNDIESLRFRREKQSHRGLSRFTRLRQLLAFCVNQEVLEEIADLPQLETLYISELTATNLHCLGKCRNLRHLIIKTGTKIPSLAWVEELPALNSLLLEHLKLVTDITAVQSLSTLTAFGFEGSIWTTQRVDSFQPIVSLQRLEALFLTNCRPAQSGLQPLHQMHHLRYLETAAFYSDAEFLALREALPQLECEWFDQIDKYGSIKAAIKARTGAGRT